MSFSSFVTILQKIGHAYIEFKHSLKPLFVRLSNVTNKYKYIYCIIRHCYILVNVLANMN